MHGLPNTFTGEDHPRHRSDASTNFNPLNITRDTFQALLDCYPATVETVVRRKATNRLIFGASARAKKVKALKRVAELEDQLPELDEGQKEQIDSEAKAYLTLDKYRYDELPARAKERAAKEGSRYLEKDEVVQIVEWKLKHGVFRPALLGMVKGNQDKSIRKATSDAFAAISSAAGSPGPEFGTFKYPQASLDGLVKGLRGIGVATASLLLSVGTTSTGPGRDVPFYSDDTYLWLCVKQFPNTEAQAVSDADKEGMHDAPKRASVRRRASDEPKLKYNASEYRQLWDAVNELRSRLDGPSSAAKTDNLAISCTDIEKVAFVLRHIDVSGYAKGYASQDRQAKPTDGGTVGTTATKRRRHDEPNSSNTRRKTKSTAGATYK
ncbi:hypothetical protein BDV25DRAFT_41695 [Aspergillus avenaceus]|uniref:Uncharacterized protein n=1 Tax=Aspergillus avenaceus TaxID=36643 RepID=A0A5N6TKW7_ASPAV|nr:hypothetical protein BDV25DRAFT_41695 [Aspergillus avenaceus]